MLPSTGGGRWIRCRGAARGRTSRTARDPCLSRSRRRASFGDRGSLTWEPPGEQVYPGREIYMAITNAAHIGSKGQSCSPAGPNPAGAGERHDDDLPHLLDDRLTLARRPGARYTQPWSSSKAGSSAGSTVDDCSIARARAADVRRGGARAATTWAKKLGYSGRPRRFCAFEGRALTTGAW